MEHTEQQIITKLKEELEEGSDYRAILKLASQLSKKDTKFQRFFIDAKTLIHLGRDSIKDHTTALIELVKNSYDADARNVDVQILCHNGYDLIRIADNGFGMTQEQLLDNWLRIGFSGKRISKVSGIGRRKTGEKGIGRISADRLGANLELISKTKQDGIVGLSVNWDDFDVEGKDVFDIDIKLNKPKTIDIPINEKNSFHSGTEIRITNLRQTWSKSNIESLYNELSSLTPPFSEVEDFSINLINDVAEEFNKPVNSKYYEAAEIEVLTIFDGSEEVFYSIKDRYTNKEIIKTIKLSQFYTAVGMRNSILNCGPIEVRLLFFLREGSSVVGTDFRLSDLREFLDNNAGVKIYRDNIAVKPYGFPKAQMGYDWLGLGEEKARNPAGIGRGTEFTVSPNQLVGAVFIKRDDNPGLTDSAAREGLVESEGFFDLKQFVYASKRLLEAHRASIFPIIEKVRTEKQKVPAHKEAEHIREQLFSVKEELRSIQTDLFNGHESSGREMLLKPLERVIVKMENIKEDFNVTINDLLNWQRVLNGLATIGISSAVFGHETEGAVAQLQGSINTSMKLISRGPERVDSALTELTKALRSSKTIAAWGAYALSRVQKEKRRSRNVHVYKSIEGVVRELKPVFEASSIELSIKGDNIYSKTFQMDIETILVNLLTNAFTAAGLKGGLRKVMVNVYRENKADQSGYYFSVADSGPGVANEFKERIFDPLFSTKVIGANESKSVGTGLGLTIVKSVVGELGGDLTHSQDTTLGGANFKVWLPKN